MYAEDMYAWRVRGARLSRGGAPRARRRRRRRAPRRLAALEAVGDLRLAELSEHARREPRARLMMDKKYLVRGR